MKKNNIVPKGINKNKIDANLDNYIEIERYKKSKPSLLNAYYKTNLLTVIDKFPDNFT